MCKQHSESSEEPSLKLEEAKENIVYNIAYGLV